VGAGEAARPRARSSDQQAPSGRKIAQNRRSRRSVSPPPTSSGLRHSIDMTRTQTTIVITRVYQPRRRPTAASAVTPKTVPWKKVLPSMKFTDRAQSVRSSGEFRSSARGSTPASP
jgi:hypothetical protein